MKRVYGTLLDVSGGLVDITDPCYDRDVWCRMNEVKVVPGKYVCWSELEDFAETYGGKVYHDFRISSCGICLNKFRPDDVCAFEKIGSIGVDAGLAGFFVDKPDFNDDEWDTLCKKLSYFDSKYKTPSSKFYRTYIFKKSAGDICDGFFTSSGFGDGVYDVYVQRAAGEIVAIEIKFITFDEEGDE